MIKQLNYNLNVQLQEQILDENNEYIWKEDVVGCEGYFIPASEPEWNNPLEYITKEIPPSENIQIFNSEKILDRIYIQNDGNNDLLFDFDATEQSSVNSFHIKLNKKEGINIQGDKLKRAKDLWCYSALGTKITFLLYSATYHKNVITSSGNDFQLKDSSNNIIIAF